MNAFCIAYHCCILGLRFLSQYVIAYFFGLKVTRSLLHSGWWKVGGGRLLFGRLRRGRYWMGNGSFKGNHLCVGWRNKGNIWNPFGRSLCVSE